MLVEPEARAVVGESLAVMANSSSVASPEEMPLEVASTS
jgi:hypothetical protein